MGTTDAVDGEVDHGSVRDAKDCPHQRETNVNAEKSLTFFRFPAEVRNEIYRELILWHDETRDGRDLLAITRTSKQARAEALPLYYEKGAGLRIKTSAADGWVGATQRLMDLVTGGPDGLPECQSTLSYVTYLELTFTTRSPGVEIKVCFRDGADASIEPGEEVEITNGPGGGIEQNEEAEFMDDYDSPYEPRAEVEVEIVRVGSPGMDWTDAEAVKDACNDAADRVESNLLDRLLDDPDWGEVDIRSASDDADIEAALDAMCIVAAACPRLTGRVSVADYSGIYETGRTVGLNWD